MKESVWRHFVCHGRVNRVDVGESVHRRSSRSGQSFRCLCTEKERVANCFAAVGIVDGVVVEVEEAQVG